MHPLELAVRDAAAAFQAAQVAAEAAGFRVKWQESQGITSVIVDGGPEPAAEDHPAPAPAPEPAKLTDPEPQEDSER